MIQSRRRSEAPRFETPGLNELVGILERALRAQSGMTLTWLNHYSFGLAVRERALQTIDHVGIDGKLLQKILRASSRTSADMVIPTALGRIPGIRVGVVGGLPETLDATVSSIQGLLGPGSQVVLAKDGYAGLPRDSELSDLLAATSPDLLIVGLGAGLQEHFAGQAAQARESMVVATCGGWLDQVHSPNYYPVWAYPLRLNWLVRLVREPRRLWRRYSLVAVRAILTRDVMREQASTIPGLSRYMVT